LVIAVATFDRVTSGFTVDEIVAVAAVEGVIAIATV
jgi:hypothetical protein